MTRHLSTQPSQPDFHSAHRVQGAPGWSVPSYMVKITGHPGLHPRQTARSPINDSVARNNDPTTSAQSEDKISSMQT
eukprot:m.474164 g.474164  ORF g.474164 m.474164 type:complete len:77 (+) comp35825_c0_seq1:102-332(+)